MLIFGPIAGPTCRGKQMQRRALQLLSQGGLFSGQLSVRSHECPDVKFIVRGFVALRELSTRLLPLHSAGNIPACPPGSLGNRSTMVYSPSSPLFPRGPGARELDIQEFCAPLHFALFYEAKRQGKDRAKEESGAFQVCGGVTPSCKPHVASSDVRLMSAALSPRWHLPPPDLDISVLREGASPEFDVPSSPAGPRQFGVGRACSMGIKGYGGYGCLPTSRPPTLPLPTGPLGTTGGTSGFGVPADPGAAASPPEKALFVVNSLAVLDVSELGQRAPMYMRLAVAQVQLNFEDLMAWSVNAQAVIFRAAEGTSTVDLGSTVSRRVEPCYHCECSHIVRGSAGKFVGLTVESRARCAGANEFQVQDQSERVWSGRALQVLQPFFRSCKPPKQRVQALQLHQGRLQDPREAAPWRSATWLKVSLLAESDSSAGLVDRVHANRKKILTGTPRTPFSVSALAHSGVALLQLWSPSPLGTGFAAQLTMHEAGTFRVVVFQVPLYASEAKLDAHDADAGEEAQEPWVKLAEDMPTAAPGGQIARLPPVLPLLREARQALLPAPACRREALSWPRWVRVRAPW
ncbi:unnamed protein product [Symbiodinium sp. KB8]|nr:unnamed protein product [Symbiodinium sp. KB8]